MLKKEGGKSESQNLCPSIQKGANRITRIFRYANL